jgi:hypothetical protein
MGITEALPRLAAAALLLAVTALGCGAAGRVESAGVQPPVPAGKNQIFGEIQDTLPGLPGRITIGHVGSFDFDPRAVRTLRPDIFRQGQFSVFDVLAHLDRKKEIELDYSFDERLNTHRVNSINGRRNYWYQAYYHGGWVENNVFPMDLFPYKDRMHISLVTQSARRIDEIYDQFKNETRHLARNDGKVIVGEVVIRGPGGRLRFENVEVKAHNLRPDLFQEGVITAIDVIMTLGEQGKLVYTLQWYESIGSAGIVKNYFVDRINDDVTEYRCGFVYEAGSLRFKGRGNHIHLPSDSRVIFAPEYVEFFYICI